ncbi:alanine--tRNA ligase [Lacticigenium naphthae]|uniref:alanine--tRNA ligase n=1 Tax=Lacticigenium naphthae TaxID=515351 RepID=UPI0004210061|nr:alanine--tRNA ligase [Lacticigenium naphthae]
MKELTSSQIRQMFLDFFEEKGHKVEKSASLVPVDDPSLLWINSGVATLKKYFDGTLKPENPRIVSSQKSIRTNDIENVGRTARHHTLFEMLGNFSIGDYFKEEAINWAWEFLTSDRWLGLDSEKLYVTVYPSDTETKQIWLEKIGLPENHVIEEAGNFWDIGAGPSGPDSEIFYDRGHDFNNLTADDPENYPGGENERWLEIWNLVFSEFNHKPDDTYEPLPNKNIDTGMGLERIVSIIQNAPTNFETDLFMPIIDKLEELSGQKYSDSKEMQVSFKVIADHIRAVTFSVADGALPSNEGRGYVIRRLLRRAVMHGRKLGIEKAFLHQLVAIVGTIMEAHYPEIKERQEFIEKVIVNEEERFFETINEGLAILNDWMTELKENDQTVIPGKDAFKLYDTYGFPIELTQEYALDNEMTIDIDGFGIEMAKQKKRARAARSDDQSMQVQQSVFADFQAESQFKGYNQTIIESKLTHIFLDDEIKNSLQAGEMGRVVFESTPFYTEKGGQVSDRGWILNQFNEVVGTVVDMGAAPAGQPLHHVKAEKELKVGESYTIQVNKSRRKFIERNHTATHLLHQAIKSAVGDHANQAGSLVNEDLLRFDFTHFGPVTAAELEQIEQEVNEKIWADLPVETVETSIKKAKEMGAMALFGEKYGNEVRVVSVGDYSLELCGGTHVKNTNEIGLFKIISESGIGAGTRRIIAKTSKGAYDWLAKQQDILKTTVQLVKAQQWQDIPDKIEALQAQLKESQRENESLQAKLANTQASDLFMNKREVSGVTVIVEEAQVKDMNHLRQLGDKWKQEGYSDVLVLGLVNNDKANLLVGMSESAINKGLKAGDLIKAIAPIVGGGGGGRPDLAQAGGKTPENLTKALEAVDEWINKKLS